MCGSGIVVHARHSWLCNGPAQAESVVLLENLFKGSIPLAKETRDARENARARGTPQQGQRETRSTPGQEEERARNAKERRRNRRDARPGGGV